MNLRAVRLANLRYAIAEAGGIDVLAELAEVSKKYLEQILSGFQGKKDKNPRSVGNTLADKISLAIGQQPGWMDQPHPELWDAEDQVLLEATGVDQVRARQQLVANARHQSAEPDPWPFPEIAYARIAALDEGQRREIQAALMAALAMIESRNRGKKPPKPRKAA